MFQCGASVAQCCSALNQHWVFDTNSRTFQMPQFDIEPTVVTASNTKRRRNVVLMFVQRVESDTALNQQRSQNLEI